MQFGVCFFMKRTKIGIDDIKVTDRKWTFKYKVFVNGNLRAEGTCSNGHLMSDKAEQKRFAKHLEEEGFKIVFEKLNWKY